MNYLLKTKEQTTADWLASIRRSGRGPATGGKNKKKVIPPLFSFFIFKLRRGFTLIELIIYVAITTVFIAALILLIFNLVLGQNKNQALIEVQNNARLALNRIKYEIRRSSSINELIPANPGTLSLENSSADVIFTVNENKALTIKVGTDAPQELTSSEVEVNTLTFQDVSASADYSAIKITLTIDYKNPSQSTDWEASVTRTTTVSLRR